MTRFDLPFDELWGGEEKEQPPPHCAFAESFAHFCNGLCKNALENGTLVAINQAYILLLHKYAEWRAFVPKRHRLYTGTGHICLFHVFVENYERLKLAELALTPPLLFIPPPPMVPVGLPPVPSPPPPVIAGIFLGEEE